MDLLGNLCIRGKLLDNTAIQSDYWTTKFVKELILNDRGTETDDRAPAQCWNWLSEDTEEIMKLILAGKKVPMVPKWLKDILNGKTK